MKRSIFYILIISFFVLIVGCSVKDKTELETGKYVMEGSETKDLGWVILEEENKFEFNRGSVTSYRPTGTYSIEDDSLILFVSDKESYEFEIDGDKIIFISGDLIDSHIEKGTIFKLAKDK